MRGSTDTPSTSGTHAPLRAHAVQYANYTYSRDWAVRIRDLFANNLIFGLAVTLLTGAGAGAFALILAASEPPAPPVEQQAAVIVITATPLTPTETVALLPPTWTPTFTPPPTPTRAATLTHTPTVTGLPSPTPRPTRLAPTATPLCPTSGTSFGLIPFTPPPAARPDYLDAEVNVALRGHASVSQNKHLVNIGGDTDPDAPQMAPMFDPPRVPEFLNTYRVNKWNFDPAQCGGAQYGCRGGPEDRWPVSLLGFRTVPGEDIRVPSRGPKVYSNYVAMVLYADERSVMLSYTREDNIIHGYAVYIANICTDPALLEVYRAQVDEDGFHNTGNLPAVRNGQVVGTARSIEVRVAVRDTGEFMDPRSRKDWWMGY